MQFLKEGIWVYVNFVALINKLLKVRVVERSKKAMHTK